MFLFRFCFLHGINQHWQNKNKYTHTRTHARALFLFSFFFFLFAYSSCCSSLSLRQSQNFVISITFTFTCHASTQLPQIESIENALLALSPIKNAFNLAAGRQAAPAAYENRGNATRRTTHRIRARLHPGTRAARIDIRFRLHECEKLFSASSRIRDEPKPMAAQEKVGEELRKNEMRRIQARVYHNCQLTAAYLV